MADATARKRRKPLSGEARGSGQKRRKVVASNQPKKVVHVDNLPWRSVDVPEMFDDAEGFFGLGEVTGVDIVRDGDTVQFVSALSSAANANSDASDDFEGFDDVPETTEKKKSVAKPAETKAAKPKDKAKKAQPAAETKAGKQSAPAPPKADELAEGGFAALAEVEEEEDDTDMSAWAELSLSPEVLSCLAKPKFAKPTAIQAAAIPEITNGHDVIGKASTGSGKTLAFAIPVVESWLSRKPEAKSDAKVPITLILSPTRELAHQITDHIKNLCSGLATAPYVCSVTGGLSMHKQQRQLEKADIVIGTPGRLWEVLSSSRKLLESFRAIKYLIVDEADRLLTDGHFKEAEEILAALDRNETNEEEEGEEDGEDEDREQNTRQTLVFSATFNKGLQQKLAGKGKFDLMNEAQSMEYLLKKLNFREEHPKFVDVNPVSQMAEGLKEGLVECGAMEKDLYLYSLLLLQPTRRTLVFTNSISSVRRLTPMLQNLNLAVLPLHSQMPQKARLRSVERFTASAANVSTVLIATDVAARGLDIKGIDAVIHYHVPRTADAYVHRSGRTARAEKSGLSIIICGPEEVVPTRRLLAKVHASAQAKAKKKVDWGAYYVRTVDIDRRIVAKLKERVALAKTIADSALAKEKGGKDDEWMRNAAEELGVEYDSDTMENAGNWSGRGSGRKSKQKEARQLSKAEVGAMRAQLRQMLAQRINTGVSVKYLTSGAVNIDELLRGTKGDFLGAVDGLDIEE